MDTSSSLCWCVVTLLLTTLAEAIRDPPLSLNPCAPPLIVVSFDAFRPEYFDLGITPHLESIRRSGAQTPYMRNVFPTKTFPNHFSIATGLYAGVHGVTGNKVYDTKLGRELSYGYELFHHNKNVLPIWTVARMHGVRTGCMMWPGSEFSYGKTNISCSYTTNYNHSMHYKTKVDTVIEWLVSDVLSVSLVMLYFDEPDFHGHVFAPDSDEVRQMLIRTDNAARYLTEQLTEYGLIDAVNVIYLSDHGMDTIQTPEFIDLTALMTPDTYDIYSNTPVMQIVPRPGFEEQVLSEISEAAKRNGHFQVYTNETLPDRWHLANAHRTGPLTVVADVKYAFQDMWKALEYYKKAFNISLTPEHKFGMHGYDNAVPSMHAIFIASGPSFVKNHTMEPFDSVELFTLFGLLLGIRSTRLPPNNGTNAHGMRILLRSLPSSYKDMCFGGIVLEFWSTILILSTLLVMMIGLLLYGVGTERVEYFLFPGLAKRRQLTTSMRPLRVVKKKTKSSHQVTML